MKTKFQPAIIVIAMIFFCACKKEKDEIIYPSKGIYGDNIISLDSTKIISSGNGPPLYNYSMRAELPLNTSLKVIMKNNSAGGAPWSFEMASKTGWSIDNYNTLKNSQQFVAYGQIICDLKMNFYSSGAAEIWIYENNDTIPTRVKNIHW